jgi:hypothetical protein
MGKKECRRLLIVSERQSPRRPGGPIEIICMPGLYQMPVERLISAGSTG